MRGRSGKFLWSAYDHLGSLIAVNLLWSVLSLPWMAMAYLLFAAGRAAGERGAFIAAFLGVEVVLFAPPTALLFSAARTWAEQREIGWRALFAESRRFAGRSQAIGLLLVSTTLILWVNIYFYQQLGGWAGLLLGAIMIWFLVALMLIAVYVFPVLISQDGPVWHTLRQSFLLAIDNIKLSFGLLLTVFATLGVGAISGIGLFCGAGAALALFLSIYFRELLPKYTGEALPAEPHRRWREVLRPWEA